MVTAIDRHEVQRLVAEDDAQLVDVLPDQEYAQVHMPRAISIPLKRLTVETASVLRSDKPVVVY